MKQSVKSSLTPKRNKVTANWEFSAIGTTWSISLFEVIDRSKLAELKTDIRSRIEAFDKTYSRFRTDSLVTQISKKAGRYEFPSDARKLLAWYEQLYTATRGTMTPLIGDLLSDAGYDAKYSLRPSTLSTPPSWEETLAIDGNIVTTKQPVILDFGAAGKGYLVDIISDMLRAAGIETFCVDAGGDMRISTNEPLRIGLEHPDDPTQVIGILGLASGAVCGSAGNRRTWGVYHHIMDPFSLTSVQEVKAVWVVADDALTADGLATALFFVSPAALRRFNFEYLVINKHNQITQSPSFPATLFSEASN